MRVWGEVPDSWDDKIRRAMRIEGWDTISAYIRELIKKDLVSKELLGIPEKKVKEVPAQC